MQLEERVGALLRGWPTAVADPFRECSVNPSVKAP